MPDKGTRNIVSLAVLAVDNHVGASFGKHVVAVAFGSDGGQDALGLGFLLYLVGDR
jgi:hypothetical protein